MYITTTAPSKAIDTRDRTRRLVLVAETPGEEMVLATLARQMNQDGRYRLDMPIHWDGMCDTATGAPAELERTAVDNEPPAPGRD